LVAAAALVFAGSATLVFSEEAAIHSLRFLRASSQMQMMIAQDQRRASSHVTINAVPRRHDLTIRPRMVQQVTEVFRGPGRFEEKSIVLLCRFPLRQVGMQIA
jgi:hypothetical protein